jgi:hypothetical protein
LIDVSEIGSKRGLRFKITIIGMKKGGGSDTPSY